MGKREIKCSYCHQMKKPTKEHTISKSLNDYLGLNETPMYDNKNSRYTINSMTTKDVCAECNNEVLSKLDKYMLGFVKKHYNLFFEYIDSDNIELEYDYDLLSKWILKTLYNSERINNYSYVPEYMKTYRRYILNEENKELALFLEVLKDVPSENIDKENLDVLKPVLKISTIPLFTNTSVTYIKSFLISNLLFYVFVSEKNDKKLIDEKIKLFQNQCVSENKIYDLKDKHKKFIVSNCTLIDLLSNTYQGEKEFIDYREEIRDKFS